MTDTRRLRAAADVMRTLTGSDPSTPLQGVFGAVGDWLESTAKRAGYTARGIDLEHAHRVADTILSSVAPAQPSRGFKIGDLVEVTGRDDEDGRTEPKLVGRTGYVSEIDGDPEYPIGLTVEGYLGPVWCNSSEIKHIDAAEAEPAATGAK